MESLLRYSSNFIVLPITCTSSPCLLQRDLSYRRHLLISYTQHIGTLITHTYVSHVHACIIVVPHTCMCAQFLQVYACIHVCVYVRFCVSMHLCVDVYTWRHSILCVHNVHVYSLFAGRRWAIRRDRTCALVSFTLCAKYANLRALYSDSENSSRTSSFPMQGIELEARGEIPMGWLFILYLWHPCENSAHLSLFDYLFSKGEVIADRRETIVFFYQKKNKNT